MKRFLSLLLSLLLVFCSVALAEMSVIEDVPIAESAVGEPVETMEQPVSITTGLPSDKQDRIMAIQMDNEPGARPQKGIGSADIVYEVEIYNGGYTRYTGVFNDEIPELVEAVRSARMVHMDIAKEYGSVLVHYGLGLGVSEYLSSSGQLAKRYDGISGISGFYRDSGRKAPNNVVCKFKDIYEKTDWSVATTKSPLKFSETGYTVKGTPASEFSIEYRSGSYHPSYVYNGGKYYRYYNGKPHKDGTTGEQLSYSNVIVQHADQKWIDDGKIPVVDFYGIRNCEYFIDGMHFFGYSERSDVNSNTTYYDADGNEVIFKPGKTFIQIVKQGVAVNINGTEAPGTLKNGSRGEDVKKLQQKLLDMGLLNDVVDGIYGGNTANAVAAAEALLGMEQTGVANPDFLNALYAQ